MDNRPLTLTETLKVNDVKEVVRLEHFAPHSLENAHKEEQREARSHAGVEGEDHGEYAPLLSEVVRHGEDGLGLHEAVGWHYHKGEGVDILRQFGIQLGRYELHSKA